MLFFLMHILHIEAKYMHEKNMCLLSKRLRVQKVEYYFKEFYSLQNDINLLRE